MKKFSISIFLLFASIICIELIPISASADELSFNQITATSNFIEPELIGTKTDGMQKNIQPRLRREQICSHNYHSS